MGTGYYDLIKKSLLGSVCMYVGMYFLVCVYQCSLEVNNGCVSPYCLRQSLFCESDVSRFALDWLVIEHQDLLVSTHLVLGVIGICRQAHCFCVGT